MENKHSFEENPNPNAKIAFVIWTPFHYYVYKNILKHLPEAEFVVCDTWYDTAFKNKGERINAGIQLIKKGRWNWRVIAELRDREAIKNFFEKYEIVVAVRLWPPLDSLAFEEWFSEKKSVLVSYGAGKDLVTFAPWTAYFDIILSNGPHEHQYYGLLSESHPIGSPKFDDWFNRNLDEDFIAQIRARLDPKKKTILYLPTHGSYSSLYPFTDAILAVSNRYNVIVKLHHWNKLTELEPLKRLKENQNIFLFDETDDILPLFFMADIVVSDSSSASLEAVLIDKPLVILDVEKQNTVETGEINHKLYSENQYHPLSIEQQIKEQGYLVGEVVKRPLDFAITLERSLISKGEYQENRKKLRENLFAFCDGKSGERAAAIIYEFILRNKPLKPVMGAAAVSYFQARLKRFRFWIQQKNKKIKSLENELREIKREAPT